MLYKTICTTFKRFAEENIAISGIWESPGDERKSYSDEQVGKLTEHARECPRNVRVFCGKKKC